MMALLASLVVVQNILQDSLTAHIQDPDPGLLLVVLPALTHTTSCF